MSALSVQGLRLDVGGRALLCGASLDVEEGQVVLLTGPSGSGKSALLRLCLNLRPRASAVEVGGAVRVLGDDALRTPTPQLARRTGLLFQDAALQMTQPDVAAELAFRAENLGLPWRDVEERVEEATRRFALASLLERPIAALSGGERKRVALAAVLAARPRVLLLDEPLGGLDAAGRAAVLDDLRREAPGRAVLVVEHRAAALAGLRPRTLALRDGRTEASALVVAAPRARARPRGREGSPWPLVLAEGARASPGLDGADLAAGPGVTVLVGDNGAGKTTLLRALLGLVPAEGTLRIAGLDPRRTQPHRLARAVGYVPQHAEDLFAEASVRDEVLVGPRALGLTPDAGLTALLGLEHLQQRHPLTLSGGEQQRLALACALAHRPRVLLLDEPTVGLDAAGLVRVLSALRAAREDMAILIATHDPELLAMADEVAVMERGRVTFQGPPPRAPLREVAA